MLVYDGTAVVVEMRGIPYSACGGPWPYHDLDVVEIFVRADEAKAVEAALRESLTEDEARVTEVRGESLPRISFLTRLGRLFK